MQFTGSFKERGASNSLRSLTEEERANGVCAASAGNHALALAWHGAQLGVPVTVAMPTVAPLTKVSRCRSFGAEVIIHGAHIGEAKAFLERERPHQRYVNGYDDPEIIAGAGTMAIEILEQVPNADAIVIPVGGAGLIAGVSLAVKTLMPAVKVYGVEPDLCASFQAALDHGSPVAPDLVKPTLADGLAVPVVGPTSFEVCHDLVDETVSVPELMVAKAVLRLVEAEKIICEGGGATGLAGLLPGGPLDRPELKGKNIVVALCGGNIDSTVLGRVIDRGLAADGRLVRFVSTVSDRPGGIAELTSTLSELGASIKDIYHERAWLATSVEHVQVKCIIETFGHEHNEKIKAALEAKYPTVFGDAASVSDLMEQENREARLM
mmetsp:Transcript_10563/g.31883  ORF Transcript_10563/g.31883 Transcript_10563/m.31883 type:complete len:380 (-) Transcript_10563:85-1224(-)